MHIRLASPDTSLMRSAGFGGMLWIILLVAALSLQIAALFLPFMRIDIFIQGGETYSLLHTVRLMWAEGLWLIAFLIAGFSVVFPFVKIALLAYAWIRMPKSPQRTQLLGWMGRLGKWSMLDPLSVLVLVMLASDQWVVRASTYLGVYAFLSAVTLNMVLSVIASAVDERLTQGRSTSSPRRQCLVTMSGWKGWAALAAVALAAGCFETTFQLPFLKINQFLLSGESYGITSTALTMLHQNNWALALLSLVCLIVIPTCVLVAELWAWVVPAFPHVHLRRRRWLTYANEWCMLDVMSLALGLFLLEGQRFIKADIKHGLWFLIAAALSLWIADWLGHRAVRGANSAA